MIDEALDALEARLRDRAPSLVIEVERLRRLVAVDGDSTRTFVEPTGEGAVPRQGVGPGRYEDLGPIASGAMGEVRRVRDLELNRVMAMKVVHHELFAMPGVLERFVEEAQATAQLQHPNIVPVHELGRLPDGRAYFTMREVRGRTLTEAILEVHGACTTTWVRSPGGWSLQRLVQVLASVADAVAFAHSRGVVHRDIKPDNVMVGEFGEVCLMDWGIAKVLTGRPGDGLTVPRVVTGRSVSQATATRDGAIVGTPAYMAPEQARGDLHAVGPHSDIYALGAMLYTVLRGEHPYKSDDAVEVLHGVLSGAPASLDGATLPLPEALVEICDRAMARDPGDRFADAESLADALRGWLDGSAARARALVWVREADTLGDRAREQEARAARLEATAQELQDAVPSHADEALKIPGWDVAREAAEARRAAESLRFDREQLLLSALAHAPGLPEAHAALAADHQARHRLFEEAGERADTERHARLLRRHGEALPPDHPVRRQVVAYLTGDGALTLVTDPPGAAVRLLARVDRHGRCRWEPRGDLGATPLVDVRLPMGSYLLELTHPGRSIVRYPVHLGRGARWQGVRPGGGAPFAVRLPATGELGPDDVYVPGGWFRAGGPGSHTACPPTDLWCDPFVIERHPVTNARYLAFLDDLVARGREQEALRHAPRERGGTPDELGPLIPGRRPDGTFFLQPDADGDVWLPDAPVLMVDWAGARAFATWLAERAGVPWRLVWDLEWEKAARGVDGRMYPWGERFDPSYACMRDSHAGVRLPQPIDSFPRDESPYGVRGMGGNTRDWCLDTWVRHPVDGPIVRPCLARVEPELRVARGGYWDSPMGNVVSSVRVADYPFLRSPTLGFRLARSV